ncbi:MAG TPA: hypothetical protein VF093_05450 [Solirubrobacterales bacterium]
MEITLLRNATLVIEGAGQRLAVDPSLALPRRRPPLSLVRSQPALNPTVALPGGSDRKLAGLTGALITHFRFGHSDHLDKPGRRLLAESGVPTACQAPDARALRRAGIDARPVSPGQAVDLFGGKLTSVPARHGHGLIGRLMGPGIGYVLRLPGEPSLYVSGDTVLTDEVRAVLRREQPDVAVMHSGGAQLDVGSPILMTLEEQLEFVRLAPGRVIAVHLEALDHCGIGRTELSDALEAAGALSRVEIPGDGQTISVAA